MDVQALSSNLDCLYGYYCLICITNSTKISLLFNYYVLMCKSLMANPEPSQCNFSGMIVLVTASVFLTVGFTAENLEFWNNVKLCKAPLQNFPSGLFILHILVLMKILGWIYSELQNIYCIYTYYKLHFNSTNYYPMYNNYFYLYKNKKKIEKLL